MLLLKVDRLASEHGWTKFCYQPDRAIVRYRKKDDKVNVYLGNQMVITCIDHPKKGRTALIRIPVSYTELNKIFQNPRSHIGKRAYYKR
jgi:hypothetical protein